MAIIGLGPIGLMFVKLAKLYGCRVIAVGRRKTQLDRAAALGADDLIVAGEHSDPVKSIREMTHGRGVDVAIEAVGKPQTWQWAVNMVRRGGTVNFFGGCPNESKVNLDTALLHYSEITCKASFHHTPAYIRKALESGLRGPYHRLGLRQPRRAAGQPAGSDAPPDEPQRPPEDGDRSVDVRRGLTRVSAPGGFRPFARGAGRAWSAEEGRAYTRWLATHHYENFHVVSFLLPKRLHQDFYNVYAYCRWADDLGDEIGDTAESLRLLAWWRGELDAMYAGPRHASGLRGAWRPPSSSTAFRGSRSPT